MVVLVLARRRSDGRPAARVDQERAGLPLGARVVGRPWAESASSRWRRRDRARRTPISPRRASVGLMGRGARRRLPALTVRLGLPPPLLSALARVLPRKLPPVPPPHPDLPPTIAHAP